MNPLHTLIARAILSFAAIAGYGWIVSTVITSNLTITPELERLLIFLLGALTTSVITVVNYWFATSQSSSEKNATIGSLSRRESGQTGDAVS